MGSLDKLISKLENNPKNASFNDLKRILESYGWELSHVKGSHHKFKKGSDSIVIPFNKPIKEVYVIQVLERVVK